MRQLLLGLVIALVLLFAAAGLLIRHAPGSERSGAVVSAGEVATGSTLVFRESVRLPNGQGYLYKYCDTEVHKWIYVVNGNAVATPAARSCR